MLPHHSMRVVGLVIAVFFAVHKRLEYGYEFPQHPKVFWRFGDGEGQRQRHDGGHGTNLGAAVMLRRHSARSKSDSECHWSSVRFQADMVNASATDGRV